MIHCLECHREFTPVTSTSTVVIDGMPTKITMVAQLCPVCSVSGLDESERQRFTELWRRCVQDLLGEVNLTVQ